MENTTNFMRKFEFYAVLYLVLRVVNQYSCVLGTVPELTFSDIEIEPKSGTLPCPLISFKFPLINTGIEDSPDIDSDHLEIFRNYLQEYLTILVNTNLEPINRISASDGEKYSPIFISDISATEFVMSVDIYYIDNPVGYHQMEKDLANRFQPNIGI